MRTMVLAVLVMLGCGDDAAESKTPAATMVRMAPPTEDCVAVRAGLFDYERRARAFALVAGSGAWEPITQNKIDNYKLQHPTCFF